MKNETTRLETTLNLCSGLPTCGKTECNYRRHALKFLTNLTAVKILVNSTATVHSYFHRFAAPLKSAVAVKQQQHK